LEGLCLVAAQHPVLLHRERFRVRVDRPDVARHLMGDCDGRARDEAERQTQAQDSDQDLPRSSWCRLLPAHTGPVTVVRAKSAPTSSLARERFVIVEFTSRDEVKCECAKRGRERAWRVNSAGRRRCRINPDSPSVLWVERQRLLCRLAERNEGEDVRARAESRIRHDRRLRSLPCPPPSATDPAARRRTICAGRARTAPGSSRPG
jgi:hypothetical protein